VLCAAGAFVEAFTNSSSANTKQFVETTVNTYARFAYRPMTTNNQTFAQLSSLDFTIRRDAGSI
jgi:hypothetical protein